MSDDFAEDPSLLEAEEETGADAGGDAITETDEELEKIKARVREMEEESAKLTEMQSGASAMLTSPSAPPSVNLSVEEKMEVDARSVYVGNVDYAATAEELEAHFHGCGAINRVTILCNKFDGHPKGFAYVEFTDKDSTSTAMALDDSLFHGRQIKVMPKRTNKPGISSTHRPPRGRGARGRGFRGRGSFGAVRKPRFRGRGAFYSPY